MEFVADGLLGDAQLMRQIALCDVIVSHEFSYLTNHLKTFRLKIDEVLDQSLTYDVANTPSTTLKPQ